MSISLLPRGSYWILGRHGNRPERSPRRPFLPATTEVLETRLAMSAGVPVIQMLSATTTDSKSVTIEYQLNQLPGIVTRSNLAFIARAMASSIQATRWSIQSRWPDLAPKHKEQLLSIRAVYPPPPLALINLRSRYPRAYHHSPRNHMCWSSPIPARRLQPQVFSKRHRFGPIRLASSPTVESRTQAGNMDLPGRLRRRR